MKIIVACDSYKGCMTSAQVADNITAAIHRVDPAIEVVSYTMADGGEGTAAAFCDACGGRWWKQRPPTPMAGGSARSMR